jgi:hypothetical protein
LYALDEHHLLKVVSYAMKALGKGGVTGLAPFILTLNTHEREKPASYCGLSVPYKVARVEAEWPHNSSGCVGVERQISRP